MSQNITLLGASYTDVPSVKLPKTGGGMASFDDTTDADAVASDILTGKTAYVNGVKLTGTGSGGSGNFKKGTVTFTQTYNTAGNRLIVSLADIGFTPKFFYLMTTNRSDISGTQSSVLRASFESDDNGGYLRTTTRISNTSGSMASVQLTTNWTTQANYFLYNNGTNIYFRTTSSYIFSANTSYNWIAVG